MPVAAPGVVRCDPRLGEAVGGRLGDAGVPQHLRVRDEGAHIVEVAHIDWLERISRTPSISPHERNQPLVGGGVHAIAIAERGQQRVLLDVNAVQQRRHTSSDHAARPIQLPVTRPDAEHDQQDPV